MRLLKYTFYVILFITFYQFIDSLSHGKIHPIDELINMTEYLTQMTEKMMQTTYQGAKVNMSDNIDRAVDSGENVIKQIINE